MPDVILLAPVILPVVGAGALLFFDDSDRYRARDPLPTLIAGAVFAAFLLLVEHIPKHIDLLPWSLVDVLEGPPAILVDVFALPFVFALLLVALASTVEGDNLSGRSWSMALLLWGGSLSIVLAANPLMLLVGWVLCELALIGASVLARDSQLLVYRLALGGAGVVVLLLLIMRDEGLAVADLQMVLAGLSPRWIAAFFVIAAIRMGLYPLHLASFGPGDTSLVPMVLGRLASAMAGLYLWMRGLAVIRMMPAQYEYVIFLGGVVALISAFGTWQATDRRSLFSRIVGFELGVIVLALGYRSSQPSMLAALEMFNLLLAGGVLGLSLYVMDRADGRWTRGWTRALATLATASILGLPPTPGFVARWGLYRWLLENGEVMMIVPLVVATVLLVPPLFLALRSEKRWYPFRLSGHAIIGLTVLGLPLALASAQPLVLAPILDVMIDGDSYAMMAHLIRGAHSGMSMQVLALIVVPPLLGYSLEQVHERFRGHRYLDVVGRFLSLEWLYDLFASTVLRAAIAVSILLMFLELGPAMGWGIVAGLLVILWALRR